MANFVRPSVNSVKYRQYTLDNIPVNIELCTSIKKFQEAYYPDNFGKPAIKFNGCEVRWVYLTEKERDADFERIANNER